MRSPIHLFYITGSIVAAMSAAVGIAAESPMLFGFVPGIIGATMAGIATLRFLRRKTDLAGFVATICGFVYYQAFQANPITLPEFAASLVSIPPQDQMVGMFLGNLTTAMLLVSYYVVGFTISYTSV
jgi:hypothetical protein